ncbi:2OG-Fe(II) oxygenase [Herbaspirillum sp. NPDC101397]|uniref:2OG-Fe(II) oxygenase n=1 Tax=Herbaspirillum sp. NPDC101397 TaxID=3364006 RepID=UPI00383ACCC8
MSDKDTFVELISDALNKNKEHIQAQWHRPEGTSTRHFVLDQLLPVDLCEKIYSAFPRNGDGFFNRESFREKKRTSANLDAYDPILGAITHAFQDEKVVNLVADIVGLKKIEPDPKLYAGGLSMMFEGDYLNPHIDNSHDANRERYRRLNLLYYVSPDWSLENGGNFELWDDARTTPKTLTSHFNRLVVMETNKISWHSVSQVNATRPRCCVSNYYFSTISPDDSDYFHVTSFSGRPDQKLKRIIGIFDNGLRNFVSKTLKIGRGKHLVNKSKK